MRLPLTQVPLLLLSSALLVSTCASQLFSQEPSSSLIQADADYREGVAALSPICLLPKCRCYFSRVRFWSRLVRANFSVKSLQAVSYRQTRIIAREWLHSLATTLRQRSPSLKR